MAVPVEMRTLRCAAIVLALALGGCASMNKNECLAVDWRTVGYEDAIGIVPVLED